MKRPPGLPVTYRLAQALTGHGAYGEYLHRFAIAASPCCTHCSAPTDDAEHTIFDCPEWEEARIELAVDLGRRTGPNDVEELLCVEDHTSGTAVQRRRLFADMVERIMEGKETAERKRQRGGVQREDDGGGD